MLLSRQKISPKFDYIFFDSFQVIYLFIMQYVERYAQYVMIEALKPFLIAMRQGLHDVIPAGLFMNATHVCMTERSVSEVLSQLTAEELRLIGTGTPNVDVNLLKSCTTFNNECGQKDVFVSVTISYWRNFTQSLQFRSDGEMVLGDC